MPVGIVKALIVLLAVQGGLSQKVEVTPNAPQFMPNNSVSSNSSYHLNISQNQLPTSATSPAQQPPFIYRQLEEGLIEGIEEVVEEGVEIVEDVAKAAVAGVEVAIGAPAVALADAYMPSSQKHTLPQQLERDREAGEIIIKQAVASVLPTNKDKDKDKRKDKDEL